MGTQLAGAQCGQPISLLVLHPVSNMTSIMPTFCFIQWRNVGSTQEAVFINVSFKIKSRQNIENDGKNLKKCTFSA